MEMSQEKSYLISSKTKRTLNFTQDSQEIESEVENLDSQDQTQKVYTYEQEKKEDSSQINSNSLENKIIEMNKQLSFFFEGSY